MSKFILGKDRNQTEVFCLEQVVGANNIVRLIDLFVDNLPLGELGFKTDFIENGRPAYHPSVLLKLYLYGYLNRTRSSRQLEKECSRNLEVIWLLKGLVPDHNTISNFRKNNPQAIKKVFRSTVSMAQHFDLIGGKLLAGDSTKLRAQNSKKNNFNPKKIEKHIAYIDAKLQEYDAILAKEDQDAPSEQEKKEIQTKIRKHTQQKEIYQDYQVQLEQTGETQISTSDPDSRQMITRNNITEVAYNVQTTVDAQHNLVLDYKVTNQNDSKAMGGMLRRIKTILRSNDFTVLYDKGYHTGSEFKIADELDIDVMVAIPDVASHAPDPTFDVEHFIYDKPNDQYTCPAGQILTTNGRWYNKNRRKSTVRIKHYKTGSCQTCSLAAKCTANKSGRLIERPEQADLIEKNKKNVAQNKEVYRRQQAIVEHPYGIVKRQWDFYYIMTKKSIHHASADVGLIFTAFNLRRIFNILGLNTLKNFLQLFFYFLSLVLKSIKAYLNHYFLNNLSIIFSSNIRICSLKPLYLSNSKPFYCGDGGF